MFLVYLKIAFRFLRRHKLYAFVNIAGLAVSMGVCLLVLLYVADERAVNHLTDNADSIFRVESRWQDESMGLPLTTLAPLGPLLKTTFTEVDEQVRYTMVNTTLLIGNEPFRECLIIADPTFFDLFDLDFVGGRRETALQNPGGLVLSERLARRFFGSPEVQGRDVDIRARNSQTYSTFSVAGVIEDLPYNSVTDFGNGQSCEIFVPMANVGLFFRQGFEDDWMNKYLVTFLKIRNPSEAATLESNLQAMLQTHAPDAYRDVLALELKPLAHLYLDQNNSLARRNIRLFSVIGVIILLISCINYVNLATAQSIRRAGEIGVHKALGANRGRMALQFIGESVLVCLIAALLSVLGAKLALGPFNHVIGKELSLDLVDPRILAITLGFALILGIISGCLPAIGLSSIQPARILRGGVSRRSGLWLRRVLVVGQFAAATVLVISVGVISDQLQYVTSTDPGFDQERVLVIDTVPREWTLAGADRLETAVEILEQVPGIESASSSFQIPGEVDKISVSPIGGDDEEKPFSIYWMDEAYPELLGLELKEGRFFSDAYGTDKWNTVLLNETALRVLGWTKGTGETLLVRGDTVSVVGVVKDFHFESLHTAIAPMVLWYKPAPYSYIALKLDPSASWSPVLSRLGEQWSELYPEAPFNWFFLDQQVEKLYIKDEQIQKTMTWGAVLALVVGCLGLYGLVAFTAEQRTREIGIRKVMGASRWSILQVFSKDVVMLVCVSAFFAVPIAYITMDRWLENFAYHVTISSVSLVVPVLFVLAVALLTVSYHSAKAASANPVDSLRYE